MHPFIFKILEHLSSKESTVKRWKEQTHLAWGVLGITLVLVLLFLTLQWWSLWMCLAIIAAGLGCYLWGKRQLEQGFDVHEVVRRIEEEHPELQSLLLTAVEQRGEGEEGQLNYLQERVVNEAVEKAKEQHWIDDVSQEEMEQQETAFRRSRALALICMFAPLILGLNPSTKLSGSKGDPDKALASKSGAPMATDAEVEVTPGDAEVEKGSRLPISALFGNPVPVEAKLVFGANKDSMQRMPMTKSLEDPLFGVILPEVNDDFAYHIAFGDQQSKTYQITTFEYPRLDRANATVTPPTFVGTEPKVLEDVRKFTAYEESMVRLELVLNKPVTKITLVGSKSEKVIETTVSPESPATYTADFQVFESQVLALKLEDEKSRPNKEPIEIEILVLRNGEADVVAVSPKRDVQASPLEEVNLIAKADDDFGVLAYGLTYEFNDEEKVIELGKPEKPETSVSMEMLLALEDLGAQPDQLISYYFWADDKDSKGNIRRNESDIYFIEVRPFLKRYREASGGGQPPGGGGGGSPADEAAVKQKDVIAATHKVFKDPQRDIEKQVADIDVLKQGQEASMEEAVTMKEKLESPESQQIADSAIAEMELAIQKLSAWAEQTDLAITTNGKEALKHEKKAYDYLLKLRAREVQVQEGQPGQGQSQGDPQMADMNLKKKDNRYQNQSQAEQEALQQQRAENQEAVGFLNRLKELAKRQEALTDKMKELEAALQVADNEAEKEKLEAGTETPA